MSLFFVSISGRSRSAPARQLFDDDAAKPALKLLNRQKHANRAQRHAGGGRAPSARFFCTDAQGWMNLRDADEDEDELAVAKHEAAATGRGTAPARGRLSAAPRLLSAGNDAVAQSGSRRASRPMKKVSL